jgi:hypothetical protein
MFHKSRIMAGKVSIPSIPKCGRRELSASCLRGAVSASSCARIRLHAPQASRLPGGLRNAQCSSASANGRGYGYRYRFGDLVLRREDVGEIAIVTLGPVVVAGLRLDQLRGHPDAVAGLAQAAFEHIAHTELEPDLLHIYRSPLYVKQELRAMTNSEG